MMPAARTSAGMAAFTQGLSGPFAAGYSDGDGKTFEARVGNLVAGEKAEPDAQRNSGKPQEREGLPPFTTIFGAPEPQKNLHDGPDGQGGQGNDDQESHGLCPLLVCRLNLPRDFKGEVERLPGGFAADDGSLPGA